MSNPGEQHVGETAEFRARMTAEAGMLEHSNRVKNNANFLIYVDYLNPCYIGVTGDLRVIEVEQNLILKAEQAKREAEAAAMEQNEAELREQVDLIFTGLEQQTNNGLSKMLWAPRIADNRAVSVATLESDAGRTSVNARGLNHPKLGIKMAGFNVVATILEVLSRGLNYAKNKSQSAFRREKVLL